MQALPSAMQASNASRSICTSSLTENVGKPRRSPAAKGFSNRGLAFDSVTGFGPASISAVDADHVFVSHLT
jgi:hypothetical protein